MFLWFEELIIRYILRNWFKKYSFLSFEWHDLMEYSSDRICLHMAANPISPTGVLNSKKICGEIKNVGLFC